MNCVMNYTGIGQVPVAEEGIVLPLVADASGTWGFMTSFNGAYKYALFPVVAGQAIAVPVNLNEYYAYTFKLYKPDNSLFNDTCYCMQTVPLMSDVNYVFDNPETLSIGSVIAKKQFIATEGQTQIIDDIFKNAKQIIVFVEGMLRQAGSDAEFYSFNATTGTIIFNTALIADQRITIIYFK